MDPARVLLEIQEHDTAIDRLQARIATLEAGADVVTGGLFGRAVENPAGEAHAAHDHPTACLNCGTPLIGSHCHACGQAAHVHRTAGAILHDIAHGVQQRPNVGGFRRPR